LGRLFGWLAIGLVIYFTYSRYHSRISNAPRKVRLSPQQAGSSAPGLFLFSIHASAAFLAPIQVKYCFH